VALSAAARDRRPQLARGRASFRITSAAQVPEPGDQRPIAGKILRVSSPKLAQLCAIFGNFRALA